MLDPTHEEAKWLKRLARVMRDKPKSVWLFADGDLTALRKGPDGLQALSGPGGVVDQGYTIDGPDIGKCEGGGW
jgi:hypothetical protein